MIRYQLICKCKYEFESWFRSSSDFDQQCKRGLLSCPSCGGSDVSKALMAPNVSTSRKKKQISAKKSEAGALEELNTAIRNYRDHITETADYVGDRFATEARKIHYGEEPTRGIYGEAQVSEIKELHEEGVDVMPLPSLPEDKN